MGVLLARRGSAASRRRSAGAAPSTFGNTAAGASADTLAVNFKRGSKFELGAAGTVSKVSCYVDGAGTGTGAQVSQVLVYSGDSSAAAGALAAVSGEVAVADGQAAGWVDYVFTPAVDLTAGVWWLMVHTGDTTNTTRLYRDATAGLTGSLGDTYSNGPGVPGGTQTLSPGPCSVYATYTPAAPPGGGGTETLTDVASSSSSVSATGGPGAGAQVTFSDASLVTFSDGTPVNWSA